ncbi:MAG: SCO family protein [Nitratireductor sp.]|nr:SCO family protein [Nitratireductor sp.]
MKTIRIVAWILVAVICAGMAYALISQRTGKGITEMVGAQIGGPFTLEKTDGSVFTDKDLAGKPYAMFFGFTHCPEVCPTTLWEASGWLKELGTDADRIAIYFVTVDPERDTGELLAEYLTSFDPRITGLTGTNEQIEQIKQAYRVYARKVPLEDGDYTMDHTASMYLMHGDGNFAGTIAYQENSETAIAKLRRLIKDG